MRELLSALKPKDKLAIVLSMSGLAVILAAIMISFSFCSASRHEHKFEYHLEYENGSFNLIGYCGVADCPSPDYVEKNISGVSLLSAVRPSCAGEGKRVYVYQKDGVSLQYVEVLPTTIHCYNCEGVKIQNGRINLQCTQEGCPDPILTLENVSQFKIDQYVEGDCFNPRQAVITYTANGQTSNILTFVDMERPHLLLGVSSDQYEDADGYYAYGQAGIKMLDPSAGRECGAISEGYYVCERCVQVVVVELKKPEHHLVYSTSDVVEPTVLDSGSVVAHCDNAGCSYTEQVELPAILIGFNAEIIEEATEEFAMLVSYTYNHSFGLTVALDLRVGTPIIHHYEFELRLVPTGNGQGQFNLVGTCNDAACPHPVVTVENVPVTPIDPMCTDSEKTYGYEYNDQMYYIVISKNPDAHEFSYDINEATHPTVDSEGEIVVTCSKQDCIYTETVTLPKVEVGVNATVVFDAATYTLLEYQYETEDGCVITIPITVYK